MLGLRPNHQRIYDVDRTLPLDRWQRWMLNMSKAPRTMFVAMVDVMVGHINVWKVENKNKNTVLTSQNRCRRMMDCDIYDAYLDQRAKISAGVRRLYLLSSLSMAEPDCSRLKRGRRLLVAVENSGKKTLNWLRHLLKSYSSAKQNAYFDNTTTTMLCQY